MEDTNIEQIEQRPGQKLQAKGYSHSGASRVKKALKSYVASSGSAQEDIDYSNQILRERGRDLFMSSPVARSAIRTIATNAVGTGLQLQPAIDKDKLGMTDEEADRWQKHVKDEFSLWADDKRACDSTGMNTFSKMQNLLLLSELMSGDCFVLIKNKKPSLLRPYSLRLQVVEADRVRTPTFSLTAYSTTEARAENGNLIHDGVEVDKDGLIQAYYFANRHPGELSLESVDNPLKYVRVKASSQKTGLPNVLHIVPTERPGQYRGVTLLAPVIEELRQLQRYTDAELTAAVIEAFFTVFVKTQADPDDMPFNETDEAEFQTDPNDYALGPGQINIMKPGEDLVFADPKRPANGFDSFVGAITTQIGAALGIPQEVLLERFNSSYSASRAALLEAWKGFREWRKWFIDDFCTPVYEIWMSEAVARGRIEAPGFFTDPLRRKAYLSASWVGPSQGQLDPVKEVTAEILKCSEGFSTHAESTTSLNGGHWDKNIEILKVENKRMGKDGPDPHQKAEEGTQKDSQDSQEAESQNFTNLVLNYLQSEDRKENG